jgi:hypothetical protein
MPMYYLSTETVAAGLAALREVLRIVIWALSVCGIY